MATTEHLNSEGKMRPFYDVDDDMRGLFIAEGVLAIGRYHKTVIDHPAAPIFPTGYASEPGPYSGFGWSWPYTYLPIQGSTNS